MLCVLSDVWLCVCSPPGSSVHGIFQARMLEQVALSSSRRFSQPRNQTPVSCVSWMAGGFFTCRAIEEAYLVRAVLVKMFTVYGTENMSCIVQPNEADPSHCALVYVSMLGEAYQQVSPYLTDSRKPHHQLEYGIMYSFGEHKQWSARVYVLILSLPHIGWIALDKLTVLSSVFFSIKRHIDTHVRWMVRDLKKV